ncbi:hypothetical protein [Halorientalis pallida]|uniref:Uncharacterized protein n=1 Tax=Halorientalis pallida TaxID=2479928 RepID=A0A498KS30_9EURY|nr:hypothetical protein [Halorientalis pallida]RXK46605.1 hypothetical protein EAF64_18160 [Halorientalis pallida]
MKRSQPNVEYLQEHGPATLSELPGEQITTHNKMEGVTTFDPHTGAFGSQSTQVYYLFEDHDPAVIVARWLEANEAQLEDTPRRIIVRTAGSVADEFGDAAREVLPEEGEDSPFSHGEITEAECPRCEDWSGPSNRLAKHLTECEG